MFKRNRQVIRRAICAGCLSQDRKLFAVKDMKKYAFFCYSMTFDEKDWVCWECRQLIVKLCTFRRRVVRAQMALADLLSGRPCQIKSFSRLSKITITGNPEDVIVQEVEPVDPLYYKLVREAVNSDDGDENGDEDGDEPMEYYEETLESFDDYEALDEEEAIADYKPTMNHETTVVEETVVDHGALGEDILYEGDAANIPDDVLAQITYKDQKYEVVESVVKPKVASAKKRPVSVARVKLNLDKSVTSPPRKRSAIQYPRVVPKPVEPAATAAAVKDPFTVQRMSQAEMVMFRVRKRAMEFFESCPPRMRCEECMEPFHSPREHTAHMKGHSKDSGELQCEICELNFHSKLERKIHKRRHYDLHKCKHCEFEWDSANGMRRHCSDAHGIAVASWLCDHCTQEHPTLAMLNRHRARHRDKQCPEFNITLRGNVNKHMKHKECKRSQTFKASSSKLRRAKTEKLKVEHVPLPPGQPPTRPSRRPQNTKTNDHESNDLESNDQEIPARLCYGSEEDDSEGSGDDEGALIPLVIPRAARVYFSDEEDTEPVSAQVDYRWPPVHDSFASDVPVPIEPSVSRDPLALSVPFGPDKFNFEWRGFDEPPISPASRRELFYGNVGPTTSYDCPYDAFVAIWDVTIMEHIARETNRYARQLTKMMAQNESGANCRINQWVDTDVDELYVYFAVIQAMGVVVKARVQEYWKKSLNIFSTPGFSLEMPYDRFVLLNRCLHFTDNRTLNAESVTNAEAKLFKIEPIVDHLNHKFQTSYVLDRNISVDESLAKSMGYLNIKQYKPNKAAKCGMKTYEICDAQTGYLWRFEVHAGSTATNPGDSPISGFVPDLVLKLLHGLEHKGHTVWMDRFYNSPALARELKARGFDCVGTLSTNRQLVPPELRELKVGHMAAGQISGCTSGDVDLMVWQGTKRIALISTYHGISTVKCGNKCKPGLVADYAVCMGRVDKKDQLLAMYPIERSRNAVCYKKLFRRLLNASILNAYILFKANQNLEHRKFRHTLVIELLARHRKSTPMSMGHVHVPQFLPKLTTDDNRYSRRKCVLCPRRVHTYCEGCGKVLCVPKCFKEYHA